MHTMRRSRRQPASWAIAAASVLALCAAAEQEPARPADATKRAGGFLEELRASTGSPAVSGAVAAGGKVVFSGGAGLIDIENQVPATGSSVYNIGSVSKVVTAVAVMQLLENGSIALDDDIRKYVPAFPDKASTISIRHLLTHTSGIRHYRDTDFPGTADNESIRPLSWEDGLRIFANDPLLFPPGEHYFYTSYGVNLLQGVVEKASGETFENYLREHVWTPAGMESATFDRPERIVPHRARSYRLVGGQPLNSYYNDLTYKFASGGMLASAEDLVKLGAALNHGLLLRPETRDRMLSSQLKGLKRYQVGAPPDSLEFEQGMLWRLRRDPEGRLVAYHCGSVKASNACLVDFLQEDLVAAVVSNSFECCGWKKADALAAIFRTTPARQSPR
jgi:serine beta-lactamase-like protein LACTB